MRSVGNRPNSLGACGDGQRGGRAGGHAGSALHLDVATAIAVLALHLLILLILLCAALSRGRGRALLRSGLGLRLGWRFPARYLPDDASEALELEATLVPFAAGLSGPVEGPKTSVDGSLVGLRTELVSASTIASRVDSAVVPCSC